MFMKKMNRSMFGSCEHIGVMSFVFHFVIFPFCFPYVLFVSIVLQDEDHGWSG